MLTSGDTITTFFNLLSSLYTLCPSIHPWLYSPCGPWPLFQFLICTQSVVVLRWGSACGKTTTYTQKNTKTD
jgi:hypothetical protein